MMAATKPAPPPSLLRLPGSPPNEDRDMQVMCLNVAALSIAALYYLWRDKIACVARGRALRERVTYMLWCAADRAA
jgi:hypothetical protein